MDNRRSREERTKAKTTMIYRNGVGVAGFGLGDVWPSDLIAYRKMWDPFIAAHLDLWRMINSNMESDTVDTEKCPPGIFTQDQIAKLEVWPRAYCAALGVSRARVSDTDPGGILKQWNAWQGMGADAILINAASILKGHQDVVMRVAGQYKDELLQIGKLLAIEIKLPDVPEISLQAKIISQIEGAYTTTKGILQIAGYGAGTGLMWVSDQTKAQNEALTDGLKGASRVVSDRWTWLGFAGIAALVGAGVLFYYVPRTTYRSAPEPAK